MKALLQVLLLIICGAGVYFSIETKKKFQKQRDEVVAVTATNDKLSRDQKVMDQELAKEQEGLTAATTDFDTKQADLDRLKSNEKQSLIALEQFDAQLSEQEEELTNIDKIVKEAGDTIKNGLKNIVPDGTEVTIENINTVLDELKAKKKDQSDELAALTTAIGGAEKVVSNNKMSIADLVGRKQNRDKNIAANAKEARISAVNQEWGFVIIGAGQNMGFKPQTELLVKRNGKLIGKIKPTAIEANTTIGDIQADSLAPGVTIERGDTVMLATPSRG